MTTPDYGLAHRGWRTNCAPAWQAYTRHRFVQQLGDGTLTRAAYLHYLQQDYVFLLHFSRAWALAAAKSDRLAEMRLAAETLHALVHHELPLHVETCAGEGISEQMLRETPERPENLAYTRFVLEAGYSGDLLDLLAALAPCVLGYGEIGAHLANSAVSETYLSWITVYSGDEYQEICRTVGQLIDDALIARLGPDFQSLPRWQMLCKTFQTATQLEVGFWDMGLRP